LIDPATGETLDQALVCYFKMPHSFTGEDLVELHCHGSPVLLRALIDIVLRSEARLAEPGEFSLRAVGNGRLRLTEAEAIRDLIDAQTGAALRQATRQLKGEISNTLQPAKDELLKIIVRLESSLEFVEDDLPEVESQDLSETIKSLHSALSKLSATFSHGRLLRDGLKVALIGRPNVGKSSLFNKLVGHSRAIVTEIPGTTRDTITEAVGIGGVPLVLFDTAGVRNSTDEIETIGVQRTRRAAADADLLIVVIDGSEPLDPEDQNVLDEVANTTHIVALNKSDLPTFSVRHFKSIRFVDNLPRAIPVSAKTDAGLDSLRAAILGSFANGSAPDESLLITNARHYDLLVRAVAGLDSSQRLLSQRMSEELVLVGLHHTLRYLDEITGETTTEEILGQIFSTFCIGK
jgi:tRNA modification GTPase